MNLCCEHLFLLQLSMEKWFSLRGYFDLMNFISLIYKTIKAMWSSRVLLLVSCQLATPRFKEGRPMVALEGTHCRVGFFKPFPQWTFDSGTPGPLRTCTQSGPLDCSGAVYFLEVVLFLSGPPEGRQFSTLPLRGREEGQPTLLPQWRGCGDKR